MTVTCRVLKIARQPYYRWLADPVTEAERHQAYLANALFDAHRDDPEFGYRFLADEARAAGFEAAHRTMWRICSANGWWSSFGKRRSKKRPKPGAPAHDDLVRRHFSADAPNELWLTDITEHPTTWIPVVVATALNYEPSRKAASRSAGVSQSSDFRGRPLSSAATA